MLPVILQLAGQLLGGSSTPPAADQPFMDAGLDSLGVVELRNSLATATGLDLPATLVFDHGTPQALAHHLEGILSVEDALQGADADSEGAAVQEDARANAEQHAFTGLFGQQAPQKDPPTVPSTAPALWIKNATARLPDSCRPVRSELLGQDRISVVPSNRWDVERSSASARFGAFLPHIEQFDAGLFGINGAEAAAMDPQQRLLLEGARVLAADAPLALTTATAVGIGAVDYVDLTSRQELSLYFATGGAASVAAGRLSYVFNLAGASLAVDTACSSSLVALHALGMELQRPGSPADSGVAAGVSLTLSELKTAAFSLTGMLAPDGRCKTLDKAADGYVRAEACVLFHVWRGDAPGSRTSPLVARLAGTAANQDGRSSGLTAPSGPAQTAVVAAALRSANLPFLSLAEMHGTGTPLGDPIEIGALTALQPVAGAPLALSASKAFAGHSETAAGTVGLWHAAAQLGQGAQQSLGAGLCTLNPLVAASLKTSRRAMLPAFQQRPGSLSRIAAGVSAFAFQVGVFREALILVLYRMQSIDIGINVAHVTESIAIASFLHRAPMRTPFWKAVPWMGRDPRSPTPFSSGSGERSGPHPLSTPSWQPRNLTQMRFDLLSQLATPCGALP